jgi:hypothetical protein
MKWLEIFVRWAKSQYSGTVDGLQHFLEQNYCPPKKKGEDWEWREFTNEKPENLEIVAILDENGESDFGVYQSQWDWVSCVSDRILKPVYWTSLPQPPKPTT